MNQNKSQFSFNFDNTYTHLPEVFFERTNPSHVPAPKTVLFNIELAKSLGLNDEDLLAHGHEFFSGNLVLERSKPIAQAYAGHQFGHFNMLGDGRANLLGEHISPTGERFDIQLKGSGPTRFSRRGDGLAALGPMLREYVISEAMFALKIPTTRSLAVVTSGEQVVREKLSPGGILARVASSHIRVGTFEYAAAVDNGKHVRALADYTIQRHYPELTAHLEPYLALLRAVIDRQASLIVKWMHVGFIHGVMNTDNMTLSGETIDYGPCAFMDHYSLSTVFSSIDREGRYAYGQQPTIALWNLTRLAETLIPLFDGDEKEGIAKAEGALGTFSEHFERYWLEGMREKLGLMTQEEGDEHIATSLLELLQKNQADHTNTFRALSNGLPLNTTSSMDADSSLSISTKKILSGIALDDSLLNDGDFLAWHKKWLSRKPDFELMRTRNPAVIPRNHLVEQALAEAVENNNYSIVEQLIEVLKNPFIEPQSLAQDQNNCRVSGLADATNYMEPADDKGKGYRTFCGT